MNDRIPHFTVPLPRTPQRNDEVVIRAKLKGNAKWFVVNFCLPRPEQMSRNQRPPYIAYHFGTIFNDDGSSEVVQKWKNCEWKTATVLQNVWLHDRNRKFGLIFRFDDEVFKVFADNSQHSPEYEFGHQFPYQEIETVELLGDFEYVEEIAFRYFRKEDEDECPSC
ncbi:uncharacterized protein LOC129756666 isoform X1 [Uranotaenia lowii]|uniref:uncharacterized protein LOC129756666 isoform X1 n=1 Tax=Uranotaenia lowii TaxID=190385 RepID=UPI002478CDFC|nr:uncharacterized protein LOC129756666 isoform X1 [Uranotaenia lowii]